MKYVFPAAAALLVAVSILFSGRIKRPLLALAVLCLQAEYTTVIGDQGESSWVGGSGPSGFIVPFAAVAFVALFLYDRVFNFSRPYEWGRSLVTVPTFLTVVAAGATFFYTPEPMRALYWLQEPVLAYLIFLVALNELKTPDDVAFVMKLLMASVVIQSLVYFLQVGLGVGFDLHGEITSRNALVKRFGGTIGRNPSLFASFINPLLMIALSRFFLARHSRERFRMALVSLLGIIAVLMTFTRAAWVGLALGLAWVMLLAARRGARTRHLAVIAVVMCIGAAAMLPILALRADVSQTSAAFDERMALMQMAWRVISDNPVFGIGAGAYAFVFRRYVTWDMRGDWLFVVHNEYLLRWAETGILGLLGLVAFWIGAFKVAVRASRIADPNTMALGIGCSAGIVALIWEMWWDLSLGFQTEALVCFLLGTLFAAIRMNQSVAPAAVQSRRPIVSRRPVITRRFTPTLAR
jgi:putative inorganic carbon (HCO3(-)) transporter